MPPKRTPRSPTLSTPLSSREDRDRVAHVREPGRDVDLAGRSVQGMEIGTNSEGGKSCRGEPAGQKRLESSEVAVLGTD